MNKIPTAEEFFNECELEYKSIEDRAIEFAKLHIKAALEAASKNAKTYIETYSSPHYDEWDAEIDKNSILNAYPIENIK